MDDRAPDVTAVASLVGAVERGDPLAAERLFETLYAELHRMARRELARPGAAVSLGVTTLLHEAYLDMSTRASAAFPDRPRFMGYAARVMRGLIIDHANRRRAQKRGGQFEITSVEANNIDLAADAKSLTAIGEALDELAVTNAALAELVDLKFFCGFSFTEIAAMRGVSERTVQRQWDKARVYLHRSLRGDAPLMD
jgi:RNA polymerase sigma factor (TIGR02999 family)